MLLYRLPTCQGRHKAFFIPFSCHMCYWIRSAPRPAEPPANGCYRPLIIVLVFEVQLLVGSLPGAHHARPESEPIAPPPRPSKQTKTREAAREREFTRDGSIHAALSPAHPGGSCATSCWPSPPPTSRRCSGCCTAPSPAAGWRGRSWRGICGRLPSGADGSAALSELLVGICDELSGSAEATQVSTRPAPNGHTLPDCNLCPFLLLAPSSNGPLSRPQFLSAVDFFYRAVKGEFPSLNPIKILLALSPQDMCQK